MDCLQCEKDQVATINFKCKWIYKLQQKYIYNQTVVWILNFKEQLSVNTIRVNTTCRLFIGRKTVMVRTERKWIPKWKVCWVLCLLVKPETLGGQGVIICATAKTECESREQTQTVSPWRKVMFLDVSPTVCPLLSTTLYSVYLSIDLTGFELMEDNFCLPSI